MQRHCASSPRATTRTSPIRPARRSSWCRATCSSPRRPSGCRCSGISDARGEIAKLLRSVALFPERAHLVGAYSLGKAQRVIALCCAAPATTSRSISTARWSRSRATTQARGIDLGELRAGRAAPRRPSFAGTIAICPPSRAAAICWSRRFPDPVAAFASGWMRVRARARQRGVELPLVISDHADWDGLTATIAATGASRNLGDARPGRRAGALVPTRRALKARPLDIVGYGDEEEADAAAPARPKHEPLRRTARPPRL